MKKRDHTQLLTELSEAYTQRFPQSAALQKRGTKYLLDGGSHTLRLIQPFPPRIARASGAYIYDEDGHAILDFWQGHYANILGHNPEVVTSTLSRAFADGFGLQTGFTDRLQIETAEVFCRQTGTDRVRFTTSGALATMYSVMLARAFTGRELLLKIGGGWHGAHPWGLKGVSYDVSLGFEKVESRGLPADFPAQILVTRYNDPEMLRQQFREHGDKIAGFIMEPFIGRGGFIPADVEFVRTARELTEQYGAVLIFDEVIAGFRFRAGNMAALYGVQPDLTAFGKVAGGGMPLAAVAGRADIMDQVSRAQGEKVKFSGGTYSGHPASLLASKTLVTHLAEHEQEIYPKLADLGDKTRRAMERAFTEEGIYARATGDPNDVLPGSSLGMLHFPFEENRALKSADDIEDPAITDTVLRDKVLQLALLLEDAHVVHGLGALSTEHTDADIAKLEEACRRVARRVKPYL